MSKINYQNCPVAWLPMLARVLRWYDSHNSAVIGGYNKQKTRKDKTQRESVSYFKEVAAAWNPLDTYTKSYWQRAAGYCKKTNYKLFVADFAYRHRTGLATPGTPNDYHQLWGLAIKNPGGVADVSALWKTIAVIGVITVRFSISKTETSPPSDYSFRVRAVASYFEGGENKTEEHIYTTPTGNLSWGWQQFTFGTADRYYFEFELSLELYLYDAEVILDNLKVSDKSGELYFEYFNPVRPNDWQPIELIRKEGWQFSPFFDPTYFEQKFIV
jgi:hypothetical protein